jgi:hypothetical protein
LQQKPKAGGWLLALLSIRFWAWFLGIILAVIGLILWLPFYVVSIYIDIAASSNNPLRPIPPSFAITNRGVLDAHTLEFQCYYIHIRTANEIDIKHVTDGLRNLADILPGGQTVDASCPSVIKPLARGSDVAFLVSFTPAFMWKRSYSCARFVVKENSHGRLQWFRTPPDECKPFWECLQDKQRNISSCLPQK